MPLLWRLFLANALVLGVASTALVLSPATVSFPAAERELVVLGLGLAVMLALNYALLRRSLAPVQRLAEVMARIDPLAPARRAGLPAGPPEVAELAAAFVRDARSPGARAPGVGAPCTRGAGGGAAAGGTRAA
jgi:two-component system, NarL family, sensor histidine kinase UhpB